jgi:hypothetical protein
VFKNIEYRTMIEFQKNNDSVNEIKLQDKPPVEEPPDRPKKPPVKEPEYPPEPPPPAEPPVKEPPVKEPPPKDPDREPPRKPPIRAFKGSKVSNLQKRVGPAGEQPE